MEVSGPAHVQNGKRIIIFPEKKVWDDKVNTYMIKRTTFLRRSVGYLATIISKFLVMDWYTLLACFVKWYCIAYSMMIENYSSHHDKIQAKSLSKVGSLKSKPPIKFSLHGFFKLIIVIVMHFVLLKFTRPCHATLSIFPRKFRFLHQFPIHVVIKSVTEKCFNQELSNLVGFCCPSPGWFQTSPEGGGVGLYGYDDHHHILLWVQCKPFIGVQSHFLSKEYPLHP